MNRWLARLAERQRTRATCETAHGRTCHANRVLTVRGHVDQVPQDLRRGLHERSASMGDHTVETLLARFDLLQGDLRFDQWRSLCHDVLTTLVQQQGLVISLQRRTLETNRGEVRSALRTRADAAFTVVQRLHQLRRKLHALLAGKRLEVTEESKYTAAALRAAG